MHVLDAFSAANDLSLSWFHFIDTSERDIMEMDIGSMRASFELC